MDDSYYRVRFIGQYGYFEVNILKQTILKVRFVPERYLSKGVYVMANNNDKLL